MFFAEALELMVTLRPMVEAGEQYKPVFEQVKRLLERAR